MSEQNNPYGGYSSSQTANVSFGSPPAPDAAKLNAVFDVTTANFKPLVLDASREHPVLVDFWAPWCGPCKQLAPILEKVVRESGGRVRLAKMNIDEHPAIAGQLGIQSIPAVIAFRNGQPVDGFMGAVPESQIREFIGRLGGSGDEGDPVADALKAADEARDSGDLSTAAQIYQAVLDREPENAGAIAAFGDMLVEAGQVEQASSLLEKARPADENVVAGLRAKIEMAQKVAQLGDPAALERRLAADPRDMQARFELAMIENAKGNRTAAADHLLTIMKQDRNWNEDGARKQLLQFFEAWGMSDEATLAARRKLSSLLFS